MGVADVESKTVSLTEFVTLLEGGVASSFTAPSPDRRDGTTWETQKTPVVVYGSVSYAGEMYAFVTDDRLWVGHVEGS